MARGIGTNANISKVRLVVQGSNPTAPASSHALLFVKADGVYVKFADGTVIGPFVDTGGVASALADLTDVVLTSPTLDDVLQFVGGDWVNAPLDHTQLTGVDTDASTSAIHHTLGTDPNQAAAGDHTHALGSGHVIQDESVDLSQRTKLNFLGNGVEAIDNGAADSSDVIVHRWEPLTNGDPDATELIFMDGDVIMVGV